MKEFDIILGNSLIDFNKEEIYLDQDKENRLRNPLSSRGLY